MNLEVFMAGFCLSGAVFHVLALFVDPAYELFFAIIFTIVAILYGVIA